MTAWILRLPAHPRMIGGSRPLIVLHVTADGQETELEVLKIGCCGCPDLRELVLQEVERGHTRLILDLGEILEVDAADIGKLAAGFLSASRSGGSLVLANLTTEVQAALRLTKLEAALPIFSSLSEAVRHFGG